MGSLITAKLFSLEAYMVLLAASIPTLRPLIRKSGTRSDYGKEQSPSFGLRDAQPDRNLGNSSRKNADDQLYMLSDRFTSWSADNQPNTSVGQGSINEAAEDMVGINMTTTVTVLRGGKE